MKKIVVLLILTQIFVSCFSFPKNPEKQAKDILLWDKNMSKEQCAGVFIMKGLTITNYNGTTVNWGKNTMVYLPPGQATFFINADYDYGNIHYSGRNMPFQWTFNTGENRYLLGWARNGEPVILVIDPNDKTKWTAQDAYEIPKGRTVLQ